MKALLDACVLFPTVMREVLLGVAAEGGFEPLWTDRILEEWARATRRLPEGSEGIARAEIALLRAEWPKASVPPSPEAGLWLPDPDDIHVLAAAIGGKADTLVTTNRQDFPMRVLAGHGLSLRDPDSLLTEFARANPAALARVLAQVRRRAEIASGQPQPLRPLLKRAGLPRLGKLTAASQSAPITLR